VAQGMGSTLMYRVREAAQRAKAADMIGLSYRQPGLGVGGGLESGFPGIAARGSQPPQAARLDPPWQDTAYAEVEGFLRGLERMNPRQPIGPIAPLIPQRL
jgi:hypothetical protein